MSKENYFKIKEIFLYLLGVGLFINMDVIKISLGFIFIFLLIDLFYFKENLEFGDKKLKKIILAFILIGIFWNFIANFDYRAVRAFMKINKYFIITFYLYGLVKEKRDVLRNFIISIGIGYFILLFKGIDMYFIQKNMSRFGGYLGIMPTALISSIVATFSFGRILEAKNLKEKGISILILITSLFLLVISQTRAALLAVIISFIVALIIKKDLKILCISIITGVVALMIFFQTPYSARFKENTFNTKITMNNASNGLRVEMWKSALWRFSQHPITGTGTKQDKPLFNKYIESMPEQNQVQKYYKEALKRSFDDAHSMYLNNLVYHGIFSIFQFFILLVFIPITLIKNTKFEYRISIFGALLAYSIYGAVWALWRGGVDPVILWVMVAIAGCNSLVNIKEKAE